jgi:ribosomal protein S13
MVPGVSTTMAKKIADAFGGSARAMVHALDAMEADRRSGTKWKRWSKELQRVPGIGAVTARNVLTSMGFADDAAHDSHKTSLPTQAP